MRPVLLIIDVQADFFAAGPLAGQRAGLAGAINELVALFRGRDLPLIWIRQEFAPDLHDAFLIMRERGISRTIAGTDGCQLLPELDHRDGDTVLVKKRYSAFFGTTLDDVLDSLKPDALVIAGVNTHACVRTTAIDAYQRDLAVVIASDCVASYDQAHHDVTMRYLRERLRVMTNDELAEAIGAG